MNIPTRTPQSGHATQAVPGSRDHPRKRHATTAANHLPPARPGPAPRKPEATRCLRADTHTGNPERNSHLMPIPHGTHTHTNTSTGTHPHPRPAPKTQHPSHTHPPDPPKRERNRGGSRGQTRGPTHTRAPPASHPHPACPAPSQEPPSPRPPPTHHHNRRPLGAAEDDTRRTAANRTDDTDTSPGPTTHRIPRYGTPTHSGAPMDAVHPKSPPQPADQGPPRDAARGHRGRTTHSEAPTPATSR